MTKWGELPENFRIEHSPNYNAHHNSRKPIPASTKFRVLADTGWYNSDTNADAQPDTDRASRYQVVLVPGESDPIVINDHFGVATPGGSFSFTKGFVRAKDQTSYLSHSRWVTTNFIPFLVDKETRKKYLHPRFTTLKAWMREIVRIENKRDAHIKRARDKAALEAKKKYPYVIDKLTGETLQ